MNIFHPRVNNRGASDGITGMQFPAYEYGLACIYKITGEHFWVSRLWSLILFSLGIVFMYWWVYLLSGNYLMGCMAAWFLCWSPELFYHGINALPDVLALTAAIGSLAFAYYFLKKKRVLWMILSMLLLLLAGLTKIQFLMAGSVWVVFLFLKVDDKWLSKKERSILLFSGFTVFSCCIGWYTYAKNLIAKTGLADVGLEFRPQQDWKVGLETIRHNLISDIPELLMGYASLIFFIVGLVLLIKKRGNSNTKRAPYYLWLILFCIYYLVELSQMDDHNYYLIPLLPLLVLVMVAGADYLFKKSKAIFLLLMLSQPVLSSMRIIPSRWIGDHSELPEEFINVDSRNKLKSAVPDDALCIVANDQSRCIWFYFLDKKGFCVSALNDLKLLNNEKPVIQQDIDAGARFLYTNDPLLQKDTFFDNYIDKMLFQEGNFLVYSLKTNSVK